MMMMMHKAKNANISIKLIMLNHTRQSLITYRTRICEYKCSFLTVDQHILGYLVLYDGEKMIKM